MKLYNVLLFQILGVEENTVTEAIRACCAFLNKCLELQQVIDVSMRNYKAFFRWLFVVIVRLLDEQTPSEIVKINQQELSHIAEFLYNFDHVQAENGDSVPEKPVKFNLERLGQYLQDQDLSIMPDDEDNPWHKFLRDNSCLIKDNDTIFSMAEFKKFSLVQQQTFLKNAVNQIFDVTNKDIGKHFSVLYNIKCNENQSDSTLENKFRVSQIFDATQQRFMVAFVNVNDKNEICFTSTNVKEKTCSATATKYHFSPNILKDSKEHSEHQHNVAVLDLQFYSSDYLSVLIQHPHNDESTIFVQVPLKIALENSCEFNVRSKSYVFSDKTQNKNMSSLLEQDVYKVLDKMDGFRIAVSGGRKVAVVLSKSYRKVRVFEMEVDGEEEEDETLDITPQSHTTHRSNNSHCMSDQQNITTDDITF